MDEERQERIRYYTFAAFVGVLLLLNVTGVWKTIFGIDTGPDGLLYVLTDSGTLLRLRPAGKR